jgi:hypothetical protein
MIDVVIPAHRKDFPVLRMAVNGVLRHVGPIRRVYVVANDPIRLRDRRVSVLPEPALPVFPSVSDLRDRWDPDHPETVSRAGWVYQQLLKLGAGSYIENLSSRYLVIDSDVVFLRPVSFATDQGRFPYSRATEYHDAYRAAYRRLVGEDPPTRESFTAHHMIYEQPVLDELFAVIEQRHGKPWHWAYLDAASGAEVSSINEQDTYGYWLLSRHPEFARHRQLLWRDGRVVPRAFSRALNGLDYDFVAAHAWARQPRWRRAAAVLFRLGGELVAPARLRRQENSSES